MKYGKSVLMRKKYVIKSHSKKKNALTNKFMFTSYVTQVLQKYFKLAIINLNCD